MKVHNIGNIEFSGPVMKIIVDDKKYEINLLKQSQLLAGADEKIKKNYIISPSGYGIHWPDIDEDLSIDGLIGIKHTLPKKTHEHRKAS